MDESYVSEIFGFPPTNRKLSSQKFRTEFLCPFRETNGKFLECDPINKKSNLTDENGKLLVSHQTGACSVHHRFKGMKTTPIIICPYRFLEREKEDVKVFRFIRDRFFKGAEIVFVPEIGLGSYGRADWMICQFKNYNGQIEILDFSHLEFQADATTGTKHLVLCIKDFFENKDITLKKYRYGLNSKASIKGSSLQMIDKGFLFQKLNKKSYWIIQDTLFEILCSIYNVKMRDITNSVPPDNENLIYVVTCLNYSNEENRYKLEVSKCYSISPKMLQQAISNKEVIANLMITDISRRLREKIELGVYFGIKL